MESLCQSDSWVTFLIKLSFSHTESQDHHTDRKCFCEKGSGGCSQHTGEQSIRMRGYFLSSWHKQESPRKGEPQLKTCHHQTGLSQVWGMAFPSPLIHVGRAQFTVGGAIPGHVVPSYIWKQSDQTIRSSSLAPASVLFEFLPCLPSMINYDT